MEYFFKVLVMLFVRSSYTDMHQWMYKAVGTGGPCRCISNRGVVEPVLQQCYILHSIL